MTAKRAFSALSASVLALSLTACGTNSGSSGRTEKTDKTTYKEFDGVYAARLTPVDEGNEIQQLIAEKTGAILNQRFIADQDDINKTFSDMIVKNKYPDFMAPDATNCQELIKAGAFIPLDNYWDDYPNIKELYTDAQWDRVRQPDGHIYYIPLFSAINVRETNPMHSGEAFWVQVKVLEWANYPTLRTPDDFFGLIERYLAANPADADGEPYIGYEIEANDAWFFALDNPPMFLDGYPNDGCCIVDPQTKAARDYNLSETAKKWFRKLNEEYRKGVIDPECFVMSSDQYYSKLETGRVLGLVDQKWNFSSAVSKLPEDCTYIPFGLTIDESIQEHYRDKSAFNDSAGAGISISCSDPEGAMKFMSDLLEPDVLLLRFWGVEGVDYTVRDDGVFEMTDEQYANWNDGDYKLSHICTYDYMPQIQGLAPDGINAYLPANQPNIFYDRLPESVKRCFSAYGVQTYAEMLNEPDDNPPWYPMWSFSNAVTDETDYGRVMKQIDALKHKDLPLVVMSEDFDSAWENYVEEYGSIDSQLFFHELTAEVARRCKQ
ncbi:MAG: sugar ABC transporter substrate-binding protein [Ruminococcus sp.]|nr:sugar ABC transporter substrate-binding protein [Ruminococcus sp.]